MALFGSDILSFRYQGYRHIPILSSNHLLHVRCLFCNIPQSLLNVNFIWKWFDFCCYPIGLNVLLKRGLRKGHDMKWIFYGNMITSKHGGVLWNVLNAMVYWNNQKDQRSAGFSISINVRAAAGKSSSAQVATVTWKPAAEPRVRWWIIPASSANGMWSAINCKGRSKFRP